MKKFAILFIFLALVACDKNNNFVLFSPEDDITLGQQVAKEIASDPSFKILPPTQYAGVYKYLNGMRDAILNSGELAYDDKFTWELHVIQNDTVLNAFATPGGYIYIYTGLIKYLDNADALAGVLGHEMAHADERHSVRNLQQMYGVDLLLTIALGQNPGALAQVAGQITGTLAGLKFSRAFETEADTNSVQYLSHTQYACNGAALFFIKMNESGDGGQPPEFLSTHPNPENRIQNITLEADKLHCDKTLSGDTGYVTMKNSLPK